MASYVNRFGLSSTYHADNEYCLLSDMKNALEILSNFVSKIEAIKSPATTGKTKR